MQVDLHKGCKMVVCITIMIVTLLSIISQVLFKQVYFPCKQQVRLDRAKVSRKPLRIVGVR